MNDLKWWLKSLGVCVAGGVLLALAVVGVFR